MIIDQIDDGALFECFKSAMEMRQSAAKLEKEAEALKKVANDLLLPLFDILGEEKVEWEGVGSVSRVVQTRTTVNNDLLKENLVAKGVAINVIVASFSAASKTTESTSVRFMAEKVR